MNTDISTGLTTAVAEERLLTFGKNGAGAASVVPGRGFPLPARASRRFFRPNEGRAR